MLSWQLQTPVAFLIFNRPETTERVFSEIARARPPKLLVVADGPRADRLGEAERCAAARKIIERVNWDCEVLTSYSDVNLGCKRRVSSGLDWVFDTVNEAIVLEDDCLPHSSFFQYCEELLNYYRDDARIMAISGDNFQFGKRRTHYSYYFSRYNHVWGWASWRRSWEHFDVNLKLWREVRDGGWLRSLIGDSGTVAYWTRIFDLVHQGKIDSWAYQWTFALWMQHALAVLPNVNLVSNIGFGDSATHTANRLSKLAGMPTTEMQFPLHHPPYMIAHTAADTFTQRTMFTSVPLWRRVVRRVYRTLLMQ